MKRGKTISPSWYSRRSFLQALARNGLILGAGRTLGPFFAARGPTRPARKDQDPFSEPIAPFVSTVTAKIEPAQRMAALLVEQLTAPVKFTQAARELMRQGVKVFVEVGPGNVLSGLLKRIDRSVKAIPVGDLASLEKLREILGSA